MNNNEDNTGTFTLHEAEITMCGDILVGGVKEVFIGSWEKVKEAAKKIAAQWCEDEKPEVYMARGGWLVRGEADFGAFIKEHSNPA